MAALLPEKIYEHIRNKLMAREFSPGGRLDYKQISIEMGVSTTPVREAMGKLANEGFVDLIPRAGAVVRKFGREEAVQIFEVREAIETYAAAKAAEQISAARLQILAEHQARMSSLIAVALSAAELVTTDDEFLRADLAFHMGIVESAGNPQLTKLAGDTYIQTRNSGLEFIEHDKNHLEEMEGSYRTILRALQAREGRKASMLVGQHIRRGLELTLKHLNHVPGESWWQSAPVPPRSSLISVSWHRSEPLDSNTNSHFSSSALHNDSERPHFDEACKCACK